MLNNQLGASAAVRGEGRAVVLSILAKSEVDRRKIEGVATSLVVGFLVRISRILWCGLAKWPQPGGRKVNFSH
jgi:hypothetical protein